MEEIEALRKILDVLWGMLTSEQIKELDQMAPEVIEICKQNHEWVSH